MPVNVTARGWDMVSSIHIDTLNKAIALGHTTPRNFSQAGDDDVHVAAEFLPWRISPEGDGKILTLDMDLRDLVIDYGSTVKRYDSALARVDVRLDLLPLEEDAGLRASTPKETMLLVLNIEDQDSVPPARVTGLEIDGSPGIMDEGYAGAALQKWLQDNLARFTHVFAAITLYRTVEKAEDFKWLKPTAISYAFGRNVDDPGRSTLGVLCQTEKRSTDGLLNQIEADVIPDGSDVGFLLSRRRFIRDVLQPALPVAFDGLKDRHLALLDNDEGITLNSTPQLRSVSYDGKSYAPELMQLELRLGQSYIDTVAHTRTKVIPGVWGHCRTRGRYSIKLKPRPQGGQTIAVEQIGTPEEENWKEVAKSIVVLEWVLGAIAALVAIVIAVCTLGFGITVVAPVYYALYGSMVAFTAVMATRILSGEESPPIDLLTTHIDEAVTWGANGNFQPDFAGLNYALQIGGAYVAPVVDVATATPQAASFQQRFAARMASRIKEKTHADA